MTAARSDQGASSVPPDTGIRGPVLSHAVSQAPSQRRILGSHATPEAVAGLLVEVGLARLGRLPTFVVDPSCGAGSFLLAAAEVLVARGVEPAAVLRSLGGFDVDPVALEHCREALRRWGVAHGVADPTGLRVMDHDPLEEATPFGGQVDLVVGNPPFLAQRTADTARCETRRIALRSRFGDLGPYLDDSAAFLLVASELLAPGGVCVMIQPQSFLSARDSAAVRDRLLSTNRLVALWADDARHFDADVEVCAPVLRRTPDRPGSDPPHPEGAESAERSVSVHWGLSGTSRTAPLPPPGGSWGSVLATALGVPSPPFDVVGSGGVRIGEVASVTAGFRDEFYALARASRVKGEPGWLPKSPRLVTCGMIDLARLDDMTPRRLAGRRVVAPRLDLDALADDAPRIATWVTDRSVPKTLVATQTRVLEVVADPTGDLVPVTPVISVEPLAGSDVDAWHLTAALSAPSVAAKAASELAGSGLSSGVMRVTASWVRSVELPTDSVAWSEGSAVVRALQSCSLAERRPLLVALGGLMDRAYRSASDPEVLAWWLERADRRPAESARFGARGETGSEKGFDPEGSERVS